MVLGVEKAYINPVYVQHDPHSLTPHSSRTHVSHSSLSHLTPMTHVLQRQHKGLEPTGRIFHKQQPRECLVVGGPVLIVCLCEIRSVTLVSAELKQGVQ